MTTDRPVVSVILPTYNRAHILRQSIRSVLDQSFERFELIVIDDASTDNTDEVVASVTDDRIRYFKHTENRGAPAARNTGIARAQGEYIAFQDSDDEWLRDKLEKQLEAFEHAARDVGVVYTGLVRILNGEKRYLPQSNVRHTEGDISKSLSRRNFISTPVAMVQKGCFDAVGPFDERVWPLSDWELWIRIAKEFTFAHVDEVLVSSEVRPDSISRNNRALVEAREQIVTKHTEFFAGPSLARQFFYIGHGSMKLGEWQKGRRYLTRAMREAPHPLYAGALLLSLMGPSVYNWVYQVHQQYNRMT